MSEYKYEEELVELDPHKMVDLYDRGFVLTRKGTGVMQKIRSLRVNLHEFELSSENRRILRINEELSSAVLDIPLKSFYDWRIHAMGAKFYKERFGESVMSANRIKSIVKDGESSFNSIIKFSYKDTTVGYTICFIYERIVHYTYPMYDTSYISKSLGIGMMTKSMEYFKREGFDYMYLGSVHDKASLYKLQFRGGEWFDNDHWEKDLNILKKMLS